jgi:hypothetical protein
MTGQLLEPERAESIDDVTDVDVAPSCLLCDRSVSPTHRWLCVAHEAEDLAEARADGSGAAR